MIGKGCCKGGGFFSVQRSSVSDDAGGMGMGLSRRGV